MNDQPQKASRAPMPSVLAMVAAAAMSHAATAAISLELRPDFQSVGLGSTINLGLYAVAANPFGESFSAMQVILSWDTSYVQLMGSDNTGAYALLSSGFGPDPYGINASTLDGNAMWTGLAFLGSPGTASSSGTLMTTFQFNALAYTDPVTAINILSSAGNPLGHTVVYDGIVPNTPVTGSLTGATVEIIPAPGGALVLCALLCPRHRRRAK